MLISRVSTTARPAVRNSTKTPSASARPFHVRQPCLAVWASQRDEPDGGERFADKDAPATELQATQDEDYVLGGVVGFDEEEPGMSMPIKAALRGAAPGDLLGGLMPSKVSGQGRRDDDPDEGDARGRMGDYASSARDAAGEAAKNVRDAVESAKPQGRPDPDAEARRVVGPGTVAAGLGPEAAASRGAARRPEVAGTGEPLRESYSIKEREADAGQVPFAADEANRNLFVPKELNELGRGDKSQEIGSD